MESSGEYKCSVENKHGQVEANLNLNVETTAAPVIAEQPKVKAPRKKSSVVLEASVAVASATEAAKSEESVEIQWQKDGQTIDTKTERRFSVTRKVSEVRSNETVVQLEIANATTEDQGDYTMVAKSDKGEIKSQKISVSEEQIKVAEAVKPEAGEEEEQAATALATTEVTEVKKKKKKTVKKKKKKVEEEPEINPPEIVSFLKNLVSWFLSYGVLKGYNHVE